MNNAVYIYSIYTHTHTCVCVCERERERERATHQKALGVSGRSPLYDTCILFHSELYNTRLKHSKKKSPCFCLSNDRTFLRNRFHLFHLYHHLSLLLLFSSSFSFASLLPPYFRTHSITRTPTTCHGMSARKRCGRREAVV